MINNQVSLNFGRNEICIGRVVDKDSNTETMEGVLGFMNREQANEVRNLDIKRDCPVVLCFTNEKAIDTIIDSLNYIKNKIKNKEN